MPNNQTAGVVVEIVERRAAAPPDVQQQRADVVGRLNDLGQIDASTGQVAPDVLVGFDVRINGVTLPAAVVAYQVTPGDRGPQVTVTFDADSVSVGARPSVSTLAGRVSQSWGAGSPDPRESIPGWEPEVSHG